MSERILRLSDLMERTGLSKSTIYLRMDRQEFPRPISLGKRAVGWKESEINAWIEALTQKPTRGDYERH